MQDKKVPGAVNNSCVVGKDGRASFLFVLFHAFYCLTKRKFIQGTHDPVTGLIRVHPIGGICAGVPLTNHVPMYSAIMHSAIV